ncbi:MAG: helicase C-terminal domain-containing protein [Candidatus Paceibacterota bacterium]
MKHLAQFFPFERYPSMTDNQEAAFNFLDSNQNGGIIEAPTGTGKTSIGYTWLSSFKGTRFYLVPNKTLVQQVVAMFPDTKPMYGRNEHSCLYYKDRDLRADEVPCSLLRNCPHRVLESGETYSPGSTPCPYLKQKYEAGLGGGIIVATYAFYFYSVFLLRQFTPTAVVVDEAHSIARSIRATLEFRITDRKLVSIIKTLKSVKAKQAGLMEKFLSEMKLVVKKRSPGKRTSDSILSYDEIERLLKCLNSMDIKEIRNDINNAVRKSIISPVDDFEMLKQLDVITRELYRYVKSLGFSLPPKQEKSKKRLNPLAFTYAFWTRKKEGDGSVCCELIVKDHFVAGLIKAMLPANCLACSATIVDPKMLSFETGIEGKFLSLGSGFDNEKTAVLMPTDTPNLAVKERNKKDVTKAIRLMVRSAKDLAHENKRSVILVVSELERQKVLKFATEEGLTVVSNNEKESARQAISRFVQGEGMCLVGTVANYGQGIDLPDGMAPVIFYFRPAYPNPNDPQTVFEENRYGNARWGIWNWRVMIDLLQVRGRNVRSVSDKGVTILVSQQFRRFARTALPEWLRPAYVNDKNFAECLSEAKRIIDS